MVCFIELRSANVNRDLGKVGHLHVKNRFVKEFAYHITSSIHHNTAHTNTRCGRCPSVV